MIKSCILLLILSHCSNSKRLDDVFNMDADDIFTSEYGEDFYEAQKRLQSLPYKPFTNDTLNLMYLRMKNAINLKLNTTTLAPDISTTERILMSSISPEAAAGFQNISIKDIKIRRLKLQLDGILSSNRSLKDFLANTDVEAMTRRFDQLVGNNKEKHAPETRRYWFSDITIEELIHNQRFLKNRMVKLMEHLIYVTRYKLVYPQLLRKKYFDNCVYKLGFLFALLRHLKNMQKWICHVLTKSGKAGVMDFIGTLYYDLKIVERLQRLDIDIKDVVLLIQKMEYRANIAYNPNYYEYSLET